MLAFNYKITIGKKIRENGNQIRMVLEGGVKLTRKTDTVGTRVCDLRIHNLNCGERVTWHDEEPLPFSKETLCLRGALEKGKKCAEFYQQVFGKVHTIGSLKVNELRGDQYVEAYFS